MRKGWKIAAIVAIVAILGVATVGVVAYAQEATTGSSAIWDFGQRVKEVIAEALGISVESYEETVTAAQQQVLEEGVAGGHLTQEQADRMQERLDETGELKWFGERGRPGMGHGLPPSSRLVAAAAEKLGMTEDELLTELQSGKSIADLAEEKGVDTEVISEAYLQLVKEDLDAQVADGTLTQEEADAKLAEMTKALPDRLAGVWSDMGHPRRGGRGHHPDDMPVPSGEDEL